MPISPTRAQEQLERAGAWPRRPMARLQAAGSDGAATAAAPRRQSRRGDLRAARRPTGAMGSAAASASPHLHHNAAHAMGHLPDALEKQKTAATQAAAKRRFTCNSCNMEN